MAQEKYGADHLINYKTTPAWEEETLKITDGKGVDFIIENGGTYIQHSLVFQSTGSVLSDYMQVLILLRQFGVVY